MCNSDRVLDYSAVTVMIDHENDDLCGGGGGGDFDWK